MGALTCYCFLFVFVQRLAAGNYSAQALYFMQGNTHSKLCHHLSCTNVRLIQRPIFFLLVLKRMDKICTGSAALLQTWMEFISPVVALENVLVAHLYLNQEQGFFVAEEGLQAGRAFTEVFHMLCIFTDSVENAAGAASESPPGLCAVTQMLKRCWPCSLSQFGYNLERYCFHTVWQKQTFGCTGLMFLTLSDYWMKSVNMTLITSLFSREGKKQLVKTV